MGRKTHQYDGFDSPPPGGTRVGDARLAALAARQHGVVSAVQLRGLGLTAREIQGRLRGRRLFRLYRGVYAVGHTALTAYRST